MTCPDDGVPVLPVGRWPPLVFDVPSSVPRPSLSASCVGTPPAVVCVCVVMVVSCIEMCIHVWLWVCACVFYTVLCVCVCGCDFCNSRVFCAHVKVFCVQVLLQLCTLWPHHVLQ